MAECGKCCFFRWGLEVIFPFRGHLAYGVLKGVHEIISVGQNNTSYVRDIILTPDGNGFFYMPRVFFGVHMRLFFVQTKKTEEVRAW